MAPIYFSAGRGSGIHSPLDGVPPVIGRGSGIFHRNFGKTLRGKRGSVCCRAMRCISPIFFLQRAHVPLPRYGYWPSFRRFFVTQKRQKRQTGSGRVTWPSRQWMRMKIRMKIRILPTRVLIEAQIIWVRFSTEIAGFAMVVERIALKLFFCIKYNVWVSCVYTSSDLILAHKKDYTTTA